MDFRDVQKRRFRAFLLVYVLSFRAKKFIASR
jgi:hypothetical protein